MKKILLVALALCLSYGFAYSCLFNHSINLTTKMQNFETDSFTTKNGKSLKITFFKHASLLIEYAGKKFFIDPVSDYADFTQQPKADYITMIISIPKRLLLSKLRIQKLLPIRIARRCWTKDKP